MTSLGITLSLKLMNQLERFVATNFWFDLVTNLNLFYYISLLFSIQLEIQRRINIVLIQM